MSFILEALKKVDRKKNDDPQDGVVMQGGRRWGDASFPWALAGAITVAVVALTVASVALFRSSLREDPASRPASAAVTPETTPETLAAGVSGAAPSSNDVSVSRSQSSSPPPSAVVEPAGPPRAGEAAVDDEGAGSEEAGIETEAADGKAEIDAPVEPMSAAPPVRLVGRAADEPTAPETAGSEEGAADEPPSGLPPLVLQGTSVIDGKPVAVVNYQRLFEGDFIEGARVVRILDRAVELEFEGTRFTLRL